MKLGLYKLLQKKHSNTGWFFIVDTSIQMGPQKCLVVLGVRRGDLHSNFCPTLEQVEVLVVKPLSSVPGDLVYEALEEARIKVSGEIIYSVVSDEGAENKKGVKLFSEEHPETIHLPDISHKINTILKKELENDPVWNSFKSKSTNSMQVLKLSPIAHLAPPRQRTKARMHSAFGLIEWGTNVLEYVNSKEKAPEETEEKAPEDTEEKTIEHIEEKIPDDVNTSSHRVLVRQEAPNAAAGDENTEEPDAPKECFAADQQLSEEAKKVDIEMKKIDWIKNYENVFPKYKELKILCKTALEITHTHGYFIGIANEFAKQILELQPKAHEVPFYNKIMEIFIDIEAKITTPMQYLGSSEIIESLFGKFKAIEGHHASSGLTSLILAIPGLAGKITESTIKEAMTSTSTSDTADWVGENLGQTFLSKRKEALKNTASPNTSSKAENSSDIDLELCDCTG